MDTINQLVAVCYGRTHCWLRMNKKTFCYLNCNLKNVIFVSAKNFPEVSDTFRSWANKETIPHSNEFLSYFFGLHFHWCLKIRKIFTSVTTILYNFKINRYVLSTF